MNTMEKLGKIIEKSQNALINTYHGETRDWWDAVDDEAVYRGIAEPQFDAYVRLFVAEDADYPTRYDAA